MLTHHTYFEGQVHSVAFERNGRKFTVGAIDRGEFHFGTESPERMAVVSGELEVRLDGGAEWRRYPMGTTFEVPGQSGFDVRASEPAGYVCEYLTG